MTISSSLAAGVSGLFSQATRLATIADNIANSGTDGYKRVIADFNSHVITGDQGARRYTAGGVGAATIRLIDEHGPIIGSANSTDLAVKGRGMLPVTTAVSLDNVSGDLPLLMTTTGSFRTDADGVLRTQSGLVLLGWKANADGTIPPQPRDSAAGLEPVIIEANQTAADPTTKMSLGVNLPATATQAGASGDPLTLSLEYFDNLGAPETLEVTFTPTVPASGSSNTWTLVITDSAQPPGANVIGAYEVVFDDSRANGGTIDSVAVINPGDPGDPGSWAPASPGPYDPASGELALQVAGGPLAMNIGKVGETNGLTQLSSSFAPTSLSKNGSPVGNLTGVEVDENGFVIATYDTGFTRTLYQVPLIDVPNPNGLSVMSDQVYAISPRSGSFFLWDAGDGPTGAIQGYAKEGSATDIANELTSLIQTQRAYSSNAKVIQTVDEMLQETSNMKR